MKRVMLLGVGLVASGCVHFECKVHGGDEVRSLRSEHFIVTSDLPLEAHLAETRRLELLWDTFSAFFNMQVSRAQVPVVVLRSTDAVESFSDGYAGFVRRSGPRVLVVGAMKDAQQSHDTNAHELTHLVSAYMLPRQPRWLAEGLATRSSKTPSSATSAPCAWVDGTRAAPRTRFRSCSASRSSDSGTA